jgi:chloramphenicol 3-O phosphotransferase
MPAYLVGVYCLLEVLEQRERQRKNRTLGQARAQFEIVHKYCTYDITVDTSRYSAAECAAQIAARLEAPPEAFDQLGRKSSMI